VKSLTAIVLSAAAALALSSTSSLAGTWTIKETPNHDTCYVVNYMPATYNINPKGIKVRGSQTVWKGEYKDGNKVYYHTDPAVYIQTKTLIEADYYSLVPC